MRKIAQRAAPVRRHTKTWEVEELTDMKRITVSLPDEMVTLLDELKGTAEYKDKPYSELLRSMIQVGLAKAKRKRR